jgi:hypothetical protein
VDAARRQAWLGRSVPRSTPACGHPTAHEQPDFASHGRHRPKTELAAAESRSCAVLESGRSARGLDL